MKAVLLYLYNYHFFHIVEAIMIVFSFLFLLILLKRKFSIDVLSLFPLAIHKDNFIFSFFSFFFFIILTFYLFLKQGWLGSGMFLSLAFLGYFDYTQDNPIKNYYRIGPHFAVFFLNNYGFIMITYVLILLFLGKAVQLLYIMDVFIAFENHSMLNLHLFGDKSNANLTGQRIKPLSVFTVLPEAQGGKTLFHPGQKGSVSNHTGNLIPSKPPKSWFHGSVTVYNDKVSKEQAEVLKATKRAVSQNLSNIFFESSIERNPFLRNRLFGAGFKSVTYMIEFGKNKDINSFVNELIKAKICEEDVALCAKNAETLQQVADVAVEGVKESQRNIKDNKLPFFVQHIRNMCTANVRTLFPYDVYKTNNNLLPKDACFGIYSDNLLASAAISIDSPGNLGKKLHFLIDKETSKGLLHPEVVSELPTGYSSNREEILNHAELGKTQIGAGEPRFGEKHYIHDVDSKNQLQFIDRPDHAIVGEYSDFYNKLTDRYVAVKDPTFTIAEQMFLEDPKHSVAAKKGLVLYKIQSKLFWKDATHKNIKLFNINLNKVDNVIDLTTYFSSAGFLFNNSEKEFAFFVDQQKPLKIVTLMQKYPDYRIFLQFRKAADGGSVWYFPLTK